MKGNLFPEGDKSDFPYRSLNRASRSPRFHALYVRRGDTIGLSMPQSALHLNNVSVSPAFNDYLVPSAVFATMLIEATAISSDAATVIRMLIKEFANHSNGHKMKKLDKVFTEIKNNLYNIPEDFYEYHNPDKWTEIWADTKKLFELYDALVNWQNKLNAVQRFLSYNSAREKIRDIQVRAGHISAKIRDANDDSRSTHSNLMLLRAAVSANKAKLRGEMTSYEAQKFEIQSLERTLQMQNLASQLRDLVTDEDDAQDDLVHKRDKAQIAHKLTTHAFGDLFADSPSNQTVAHKEAIAVKYLEEQSEKINKASEKLYIAPSGGADSAHSLEGNTVDAGEQSADEDATTPTTLASFASAQDWSISVDL